MIERGKPVATIALVSDYAAGEEKSWDDLRKVLRALRDQDFGEPFEILLCEDERFASAVPPDLTAGYPNVRILFHAATSSYGLKNAAAEAAAGEYLVLLDADCTPRRGWLRSMVEAFRANPDAAAVSGKTQYAGRSLMERLLSLLTRAYLDPGGRGPTRFVSNNNSGMRIGWYRKHPLRPDLGAFSSRLQSEAIHREGGKLLFDPGMEVVHDFEGWHMEADIRRNHGFCTVITRLEDNRMPYAWLTRFGVLSIPAIVAGKTLDSWANVFRCASAYRVRWYETPLALGFALVLHLMEIPGMWQAFERRLIVETAYR